MIIEVHEVHTNRHTQTHGHTGRSTVRDGEGLRPLMIIKSLLIIFFYVSNIPLR